MKILDSTRDDVPYDKERQVLKTRAVQGACNSVGVAGFYPHGGAQAGIHTEMEGMGKGKIREIEIKKRILHFREKSRTKNPRLVPRASTSHRGGV